MEQLYKAAHRDDNVWGNHVWSEGVTHTAAGDGPLFAGGWIQAQRSPLLAVLLDLAAEARGADTVLWECEGDVGMEDHCEVGCIRLTALRRMPYPEVTAEQRVRFALLVAKAGVEATGWGDRYDMSTWLAWAQSWLDGTDRSARSAKRAHDAACEIMLSVRRCEKLSDERSAAARAAMHAADAAMRFAIGPARSVAAAARAAVTVPMSRLAELAEQVAQPQGDHPAAHSGAQAAAEELDVVIQERDMLLEQLTAVTHEGSRQVRWTRTGALDRPEEGAVVLGCWPDHIGLAFRDENGEWHGPALGQRCHEPEYWLRIPARPNNNA